MKKLIAFAAAFVFALSLTVAFAADKAADSKTPAVPAKESKKSAAKKHQLTGEVKAVDAKAATLTIKGKKEMTFTADEKMLKDVKIGDKIVVTYTEAEGKATATGIKAKKTPKKIEPKKEDKKDDKKAEPAPKPAAQDSKPAKKKKAIEGC